MSDSLYAAGAIIFFVLLGMFVWSFFESPDTSTPRVPQLEEVHYLRPTK